MAEFPFSVLFSAPKTEFFSIRKKHFLKEPVGYDLLIFFAQRPLSLTPSEWSNWKNDSIAMSKERKPTTFFVKCAKPLRIFTSHNSLYIVHIRAYELSHEGYLELSFLQASIVNNESHFDKIL